MLGILRKFWLVNPALLGLVLLLPTPGMAADAVAESTEVASAAAQIEAVAPEAVDAPQVVAPATDVELQGTDLVEAPQVPAQDLLAQAEQSLPPAPAPRLAQRTVPPDQNPVTSVDELSDLEPGIWYYDAIVNLVNKYQCVAGYPDGTFRPRRSISRAEMAVLLNNCLEAVAINQEDIETIKQLQEEFAAELATLRGRVDGLDARVATVEAQQFSTTTKLNGEVVIGLAGVIDDDDDAFPGAALVSNAGETAPNIVGAGPGALVATTASDDDRVFVGPRVRLNFDTSFSGKDRLRVRLEAADITELDGAGCGTDLCRLGFDEDDPAGTTVILDELNYRFKPAKGLTLKASVVGGDYKDDVETFNPLKSSGSGALSRFFRVNPVTHRAPGDTTFSAVYEPNDIVEFAVMYAADDADDATTDGLAIGGGDSGLFGGQYGVMAQVGVTPAKNLRLGVQYAFANFEGDGVNLTASTADAPTNLGGDSSTLQPFGDVDTQSHNFGFNVQYQPVDQFIFAGWAGLTLASPEDGSALALPVGLGVTPTDVSGDQVTLINWAANLIFPDLLAEGNRGFSVCGSSPLHHRWWQSQHQ